MVLEQGWVRKNERKNRLWRIWFLGSAWGPLAVWFRESLRAFIEVLPFCPNSRSMHPPLHPSPARQKYGQACPPWKEWFLSAEKQMGISSSCQIFLDQSLPGDSEACHLNKKLRGMTRFHDGDRPGRPTTIAGFLRRSRLIVVSYEWTLHKLLICIVFDHNLHQSLTASHVSV